MSFAPVRTEAHALSTPPEVRADIARTVDFFQRVVRMLCTVVLTHWPELGALRSQERLTALEGLFHTTKLNPKPRYALLARVLGKMPSYLRRAAINAACGAVSSYLSNYSNWLDDVERERGARPPRLGLSGIFPSLYGGNMLREGDAPKLLRAVQRADFCGPLRPKKARTPAQLAAQATKAAELHTPAGSVRLKLLGADGRWSFSVSLKLKGKCKRLQGKRALSPTLMLRGAKAWLSCPVELKRNPHIPDKHVERVASFDVGINTAATASVVDRTGTVIARKFMTCGRHNDQRDVLSSLVRQKQQQSNGGPGRRLGEGFCKGLYRRISGLSLQAARELATQAIGFALEHRCQAVVIEALKGYRPTGRGAHQKKRFHRFQHRLFVRYLLLAAEEHGLRVVEVYAGGTSRYAFDGSGKVVRDAANASNCTFANGKQFNADLNAAYNIAARGLAQLMGVKKIEEKPAQGAGAETGKSSGSAVRMPLVLADIWAHARVAAAAL